MIAKLEQAVGRPVSRETFEKVQGYASLLTDEAKHQNLISQSSIDSLWQRHILDSAQLMRFAPSENASWVDVGSGAGLPGILLAILAKGKVVLVEPRRLRAEFLGRLVGELRLANAEVVQARSERVEGTFDIITARAVAALPKLLGITAHLAHRETLWVLPKGRTAKSELADAERSWHYEVRAEPSWTDKDSSILLLSNVRAKSKK